MLPITLTRRLALPHRLSRQHAEWLLLGLLLGMGALLGLYLVWSEDRMVTAAETDRMQAQVRIIDENLRHQMAGVRGVLESVRDSVSAQQGHCAKVCDYLPLHALRSAMPGVHALLVLDGKGNILQSSEASGRGFLRDTAFLRDLPRLRDPQTVYLSAPYEIKPGEFDIKMAMALPVPDGSMVVAILDPDYFDVVMRSVLYAPDMRSAITESGGRRILFVPRDPPGDRIKTDAVDPLFVRHRDSGQQVTVTTGLSAIGHDNRLMVQRTITSGSLGFDRALVVGVSRNLAAMRAPVWRMALDYFASWLTVALASAWVLYVLQRRRSSYLALEALRQAERAADAQRIELALNGAQLGLWDWNVKSDQLSLDARAAAMLGCQPRELDGPQSNWLRMMHEDDRAPVLQALELHFADDTRSFETEYRLRHRNGDWVWVLSRGKAVVRDAAGRPLRMVGTHMDITARKVTEAEVQHLAFYDSLTDLPNRRLLRDRLAQALAKAHRSQLLGAVLFIDLDNFKRLNDTLGHDMGDLLLKQVARRLQEVTRETDTVARLGGDEFVVLLENLDAHPGSAAAHAEQVAGKILKALAHSYRLGGTEVHSSPSIGVTLFGAQPQTVDDLLKQADMAMYEAKADGRNTFRFFDPLMQTTVHDRATLESDLRDAVRRNEFLLHYQPIVDLAGRMVGVEALARWMHPTKGLLGPGQFIAEAERSGLIDAIGEQLLRQACEQLARWAQQPDTAELAMAINISAHQFQQRDFVAQVLEVLEATGANPAKLKLELTESASFSTVKDMGERLAALKARGVGFSLDDFGTGYSSLSYLTWLPFDQLKIDQMFVKSMLETPNSASVVRAILALASSLGLEVVAEGVETEGQRRFLQHCGCQLFQGYLFAQPAPEAAVRAMLLAQRTERPRLAA